MKYDDAERKVKAVLADLLSLPPKDIKSTSSLSDDLGVDSFCKLELCFALEKTFNIDLAEHSRAFPQNVTVKDLADLLTAMKADRSAKE